jgi:thiol:disulfide interchange protein DsbD
MKPMLRLKQSLLILLACFTFNAVAADNFNQLFSPERGSALVDVPPPEQAFKIEIKEINDDGITLHWSIAPQTYLYQKAFEFSGEGVVLGSASMPPGDVIHDPFFGDVAVYYQGVDVFLPFLEVSKKDISLNLGFQGCHEAGICYPPQTETFSIKNVSSVASVSETIENEQTYIMNILNNVSTPLALLAFFGFGFLLALTPCVLPMVPILSALIIGEQQHHHRLKALYLGIVYVLAMAVTYAALGAIVASLGAHIQAQLQNPVVISITATILLAMAFLLLSDKALHALSHFNGPLTKLAERTQGGKFFGVAIMGAISALVISPCVTPPLVGALTYITISGDVALGASALFALAIGMGIPLIAVTWLGTAVLPKRGIWMQHIKHLFSVLLIAMAIYLFSRFMAPNIVLGLWGLLFVGIAFWIGFWPLRAEAMERVWQAVAWVFLVYGSMSLLGGAMGNVDLRKPLALHSQSQLVQDDLTFVVVHSTSELDNALQLAAEQNKPAMVYFYADWCTSCTTMQRNVFSKPEFEQAVADVMLIKVNVTDYNNDAKRLLEQYQVFGPPAFMFYAPDGREQQQFNFVGDKPLCTFIDHIESWQTSY